MAFDIYETPFDDWGGLQSDLYEQYKSDLMAAFANSKEYKECALRIGLREPFWSELFVEFTLLRLDMALHNLDKAAVRQILYQEIPARVIVEPEEAESIIIELTAFWTFLERTTDLDNAKECLEVFQQKTLLKRLTKELGDDSQYSFTKGLAKEAINKGVDITDEGQMMAFIDEYNTQIQNMMAGFVEGSAPELSEKLQARRDRIIAIAEPICKKHLNEGYAELAHDMTETLCYVHPTSPLERGKEEIWAAAIVYALGQVNFLFDPTQDPHMSASDLCALFDCKQGTISAKASKIADVLDIRIFDPEWTLPDRIDDNPLIWLVTIDGMPVDLRTAPREVQEAAFKQGLIPYIPADRQEK